MELPPWMLALVALLAFVVAGVILIVIGTTLIGSLVLVAGPLVALAVWIGAGERL